MPNDAIYDMLFEEPIEDVICKMLFEDNSHIENDHSRLTSNKVTTSYLGRTNILSVGSKKKLHLLTPEENLINLGISNNKIDGTLIEQIQKLLAKAQQNKIFGTIFSNTSKQIDKLGREGLLMGINDNEVPRRHAAHYLRLLLINSFILGVLHDKTDVRIQGINTGLLIYPSKNGKSRWEF
jgi:hypothetical protein